MNMSNAKDGNFVEANTLDCNTQEVVTSLANLDLDIEEAELPEVKRRVNALKNIQVEYTKLEARFYKDIHDLECKYMTLYSEFFNKRRAIITGFYDPTPEECVYQGLENEPSTKGTEENDIQKDTPAVSKEVAGIPNFWLTVLLNMKNIAIEEYDTPILKYLTEISCDMFEKPMGFRLSFHFSPNDYFTNPVLTKTYEMACKIDQEDPLSFEGPEIIRCIGCPISWLKNKNVTMKKVKKMHKNKQSGAVRTVEQLIKQSSFFLFFNPPKAVDGINEEDARLELTLDFEVGNDLRERIIPRAVLWYTGEAADLTSDSALGEEEDESEDDDEFNDSLSRSEDSAPSKPPKQECIQQ